MRKWWPSLIVFQFRIFIFDSWFVSKNFWWTKRSSLARKKGQKLTLRHVGDKKQKQMKNNFVFHCTSFAIYIRKWILTMKRTAENATGCQSQCFERRLSSSDGKRNFFSISFSTCVTFTRDEQLQRKMQKRNKIAFYPCKFKINF